VRFPPCSSAKATAARGGAREGIEKIHFVKIYVDFAGSLRDSPVKFLVDIIHPFIPAKNISIFTQHFHKWLRSNIGVPIFWNINLNGSF
jgi:hypothetical protein